MKNTILTSAVLFLCAILFSSSANCPTGCNTCTIDSLNNTYKFKFSTCNVGLWQAPNYLNERYYMRWVFTDGGNTFDIAISSNPTFQTAQALAFAQATNTYGDDDDASVVTGSGAGGAVPTLSNTAFPLSQNNISNNQLIKITTAHSTNKAQRCNQLLLILTINNDSTENRKTLISQQNFKLSLFQNKAANKFSFLPPNTANKYFTFAAINNNAWSYNGLTFVQSWNIVNNFQGHEKNVYCLLDVSDQFTEGLEEDVEFTAVLTSGSNNTLINANTGIDAETIKVCSAYDPNLIEVNKPVSQTCGEQGAEEYEYTIHFQNMGTAEANKIFINLETDAAIDPATVIVTDARIGSGPNLLQNNTAQYFTDYNFQSQNNPPAFLYSKNTNAITSGTQGAVLQNISFQFSNAHLKEINFPDVIETMGYIKFKAKTSAAFTSLNNRAGIFFDNNSEIITNLAVTVCENENSGNGISPCENELEKCKEQLKKCKKDHGSGNAWLTWSGWILACIFIILYLMKRKRIKK